MKTFKEIVSSDSEIRLENKSPKEIRFLSPSHRHTKTAHVFVLIKENKLGFLID